MLKLFAPFERLGASNGAIEGTGLGLVLSQHLASAMNGALRAESALGQGSTFTLELPQVMTPAMAPGRAPEATQSAASLDAARKVERVCQVLCIEHNASNFRLIEVILEERSRVILLSATQGEVGLELARQRKPDLILLDLHLPDMQCQEVLDRLQQEDSTRNIPVIVISADATPVQIKGLLGTGAKAYLTKPLNVIQFLDTVDQFLS